MIKRYSKLIELPTFEERFEYLRLNGVVSELTFGHNRYLNQDFYQSKEWQQFRRDVILRDDGCDLACPDRQLERGIIIHHLNPITVSDILEMSPSVFDFENVVCVSHKTHNAIHYGDSNGIVKDYVERKPNDTIPWR